ncbi:signal recognition particle-docking protein FtsY [Chitinimonas viridis]|uniref:Signal recognition particle receptor FtsY n=1 Tax=Chitinimonas viridis TaxID=664880 RepID=A0ABT8B7V6_9NEIS|nr:signal recognition particle-docking protein FtsY [Chitinimonas viridis]MDN3577857.1 signal recognition particle-docking protein FtsY [Chitinimonas viridis]
MSDNQNTQNPSAGWGSKLWKALNTDIGELVGGEKPATPQPAPTPDAAPAEPAATPVAAPVAAPATVPSPAPAASTSTEDKSFWQKTVEVLNTDVTVLAKDVAQASREVWQYKLKAGLAKTRDKLGKELAALFGGGQIDEDLYEELETVLLTADMGVDATVHLLKDVRQRVSLAGLKDASELRGALKGALTDLIAPLEKPLQVEGHKPYIIMVAGVNGAGKTTSIGKLAKYFQGQGKSVLLAAGDTFRAAAREQLMAWGERNNVTVIAQDGGDSAAVCFDAINAAKARGIDIVLADTAGRLPTQLHLMDEIAKVKRVIAKADPSGPHEILLVLDANTGQNALQQVKAFDDALGLTGLVLTKLDGTAKGGVIAGIAKQKAIPLRFIGVGEGIDDLRPFEAKDYVDALIE